MTNGLQSTKSLRFNHIKYLVILLVIIVALVTGLTVFVRADKYSMPSSITKRVDFPLLFLKKPSNGYLLDKNSIKYSAQPDDSNLFSFVVYNQNTSITFSEQAYPEALIYDKFTNSLNPYSEVGTIYGKVTLGKPKNSGDQQIAGFKYTDSTLIFAKPTHGLSDPDWRQLINSLEPVK